MSAPITLTDCRNGKSITVPEFRINCGCYGMLALLAKGEECQSVIETNNLVAYKANSEGKVNMWPINQRLVKESFERLLEETGRADELGDSAQEIYHELMYTYDHPGAGRLTVYAQDDASDNVAEGNRFFLTHTSTGVPQLFTLTSAWNVENLFDIAHSYDSKFRPGWGNYVYV